MHSDTKHKLHGPVISYDALAPKGKRMKWLGEAQPKVIDGRTFTIDGAAIYNGRLVTRTESLTSLSSLMSSNRTLKEIGFEWQSKSTNPNALLVTENHTDSLLIAPDPLGGATVFYYSGKNSFFVSADLSALVFQLRKQGIKLTKSLDFQFERLLIGNTGTSNSSYKEISALESFEYIVLKNDSVDVVNTWHKLVKENTCSNFELLIKTREDIINNVVAAAGSQSSNKISHITGGFDSRLVLAATEHAGVSRAFKFFCSGPAQTRDRVIADGLSSLYKLKRTTNPGLVTGKANSITERLLGPLFSSEGILTTGPNGREETADIVALGGGYGEMYRTVYAERLAGLKDPTKESLLKAMLPWTTPDNSFVSAEAWDHLGSSLEKQWQNIVAKYDDDDFRGDALWIHRRARIHFGQGAMAWSRVGSRIDPAYSLNGYLLAQKTPLAGRKLNILGFDLMDSMVPELSRFEFDKPRFSNDDFLKFRRFTRENELPKDADFIISNSLGNETNDSNIIPESIHHLILDDREASADDRKLFVQQANQIGVNYWQAANYADARKVLSVIVRTYSGDSSLEGINWDYVRSLLSGTPVSRSRIRDTYSAIALLSWQIA